MVTSTAIQSATPAADHVLAAAREYVRRGWSVVPIPYRSKNPGFRGWQQVRLKEHDLPERFNGSPQNIGVLLGEPSGWLVDIDLDHPRCTELADSFLPITAAMFGRVSKPRSHRIYRVSAPLATKKFKSKSAGMLAEVRSTRQQTVFPPSTHESGEAIAWEQVDVEPALVAPEHLLLAVQGLTSAVKIELGERAVARAPRLVIPFDRSAGTVGGVQPPPADRIGAAVAAMLHMRLTDHADGSARLFAAACRAVEHDLDDDDAVAAIRRYAQQRPFPRSWSDGEILQRLRDAEHRCTRAAVYVGDEHGHTPLGYRDPESGKLILSPKRTLPTAEAFVREFHDHPEGSTLRSYAGQLMAWRDSRYVSLEEQEIAHVALPWLHAARYYVYSHESRQLEQAPFPANPATVKATLESLHARTHLPASTSSPSWLHACGSDLSPGDILPCKSGLLHLPTMQKLSATPAFFSVSALDYDYQPDAPEPRHWQAFLGQLLQDDLQAWDLLQEWFGYCLTGDTSQHKMLLIVGPRRSGKGTIARVLARLVGAGNVCGPTTSALAGPFGLQPLIGKSLAIVSDARFSGENIHTVVERLLCISGEDTLTIERKHTTSVTMKLPTRFVFLTNELPRLTDASGALSGRFMMLRLTESFFGREDKSLTSRLLTELTGILNWSIEGWRQLRERGHFIQPASVECALRDMEDLSSPVGAFVRERCDVHGELRAWIDELYRAWEQWCKADGRVTVTTKQTFGRDLMAAVPGVITRCGTNGVRFYQGIALKGVTT